MFRYHTIHVYVYVHLTFSRYVISVETLLCNLTLSKSITQLELEFSTFGVKYLPVLSFS